jgi:hypothetical protein
VGGRDRHFAGNGYTDATGTRRSNYDSKPYGPTVAISNLCVHLDRRCLRRQRQNDPDTRRRRQLVTIPLFGKQEIRAAIISPPGAVEKTYRILLDVLPPLSSAEQLGPGVHLSIRTRFTVPIFQEPLAVRMSGQITTAAAKRGTVQFTILNSGNTHLGGDEIRIIGRNDGGRVIFSEAFRGWYVLIDSKRTFSSHLPQNACGDVRSVTIAPPPDMNVLPKKIEVASGVCGA